MHPAVVLLSLAVSLATLLVRGAAPAGSSTLPPTPPPAGRGYTITDCTIAATNPTAARTWARALAASLPVLTEWTEEAALAAWGPVAIPALFDACPQLQDLAAWDAHPALGYQLLLGLAEGLRLHHKAPAIVVSTAFATARAAMVARGWAAEVLVPEAPEVP